MSSPLREVLLTVDATHQIWRKPPARTCVHQQIHAQCCLHANDLQDVEGASVNKQRFEVPVVQCLLYTGNTIGIRETRTLIPVEFKFTVARRRQQVAKQSM